MNSTSTLLRYVMGLLCALCVISSDVLGSRKPTRKTYTGATSYNRQEAIGRAQEAATNGLNSVLQGNQKYPADYPANYPNVPLNPPKESSSRTGYTNQNQKRKQEEFKNPLKTKETREEITNQHKEGFNTVLHHKNAEGRTNLAEAAYKGDLEGVSHWIKSAKKANLSIKTILTDKDKNGATPLLLAIVNDYYTVVDYILSEAHAANILDEVLTAQSATQITALMIAAQFGCVKTTEKLLSYAKKLIKTDPIQFLNARDKNGKGANALMFAASINKPTHQDVFYKLLDHIKNAVNSEDFKKILLTKTKIKTEEGEKDVTVLDLATKAENIEIAERVESILRQIKGPDVDLFFKEREENKAKNNDDDEFISVIYTPEEDIPVYLATESEFA